MKFYMIFSENSKYNNVKYKKGLNIKDSPFLTQQVIEEGELYFASSDIFACLCYGCKIAEVKIPKGIEIVKVTSHWTTFNKSDSIILKKIRTINQGTIRKLIKQGANIHVENDCLLKWASFNGYFKIVKFLIAQNATINSSDNYPLTGSIIGGHLKIVKFLIKKGANLHPDNNSPLQFAAARGHLRVVKYLINLGIDIHEDNDCSLFAASLNNYLKVVKYLVSNGANIHAGNDSVLKLASRNGHIKMVKFLVKKGVYVHAEHDYSLRWALTNNHTKVINYLKSLNYFRKHIIYSDMLFFHIINEVKLNGGYINGLFFFKNQ